MAGYVGWQDKLEKAIMTGNMELVREYYEHFYEKKPPKCPEVMLVEEVDSQARGQIAEFLEQLQDLVDGTFTKSESKPKKPNKKLTRVKKSKVVSEEPENIEDEQDEESEVEADVTTATIKDHKGNDREVKFVTGQTSLDQDPKYKAAVKKLGKTSKTIQPRNEYKPAMVKCDQCGKEFNFKSEQIMKMERGAPTLCGKCAMRR